MLTLKGLLKVLAAPISCSRSETHNMLGVRSFCILLILAFYSSVTQAQGGWSQDEMEIFDLVEEVDKNFYEFMSLSPDASSAEVRKAYRRLSLQLHPDKNPAPDAALQFRLLAGIYEVLKESSRREIYDRVLVEGLPSWKNPIFYYRRVRKMGLAEGVAYLFVIVSFCQYLINWAAYWERGFTFREVVSAQNKRKRSKIKSDIPAEHEESILGPKPTFWDTLPFQLFRGGKYLMFNLPYLPKYVYEIYSERCRLQKEEEERIAEEEEAIRRKEEEKKERKEQKAKRKRVYREEAPDKAEKVIEQKVKVLEAEKVFNQPANALQIWTDDDLARLAKLMKKFPGGVRDRWERIAEIMERLPWEVTKMAQKVKEMGYCVPISNSTQGNVLENDKLVSDNCLPESYPGSEATQSSIEDSENDDDEEYGVYKLETRDTSEIVEVKTKTKTKGGKLGSIESSTNEKEGLQISPEIEIWSQQQQKELESALLNFPKGISERWDRISAKVHGKTKQQCMIRYKTIVEEIKKKKEISS